jgi:hypothetical protein
MGIELAKRGRTDGHERLSCDADFHIGAHILLLARGKDGLELAKKEVLSNRKSETQLVDTIALDLCDPVAVRALATNSAKFMLSLILTAHTKNSTGEKRFEGIRDSSRHSHMQCRWLQSRTNWVSGRSQS